MFTRKHAIHTSLLASDLALTVPASELETLDRLATTIQIAAGDEIMHADEFGRECFIVIDGEFQVQLDDTSITVGPGAVIGELALLTLKPRTASVTATVDSSVYVLSRAEFATLLDTCPRLSRYVLDGALRRTTAAA
jgi:CRP-like cAMP-binding protein